VITPAVADAAPVSGGSGTPSEQAHGHAVRGGAYTMAGFLLTQTLRMGGNIVLTRLLNSEAFGIMAIVYTFLTGLALFSDVGIGPSIIQNSRGDDPKFLNTAWTVQFGRGLILFTLAVLAAAPVAWFFEAPALLSLVPVAAFAGLIEGSQSVKHYTTQRHLALGRLTLIEVLSQVAALVVMLTWALVSPSVWALVAGGLTGALTDVILSHTILSGYNARFGWDKRAGHALLTFGRWIFISTLLTFAVGQADRLIFAKMIPLALLGVYSIALQVAMVPTNAMRALASRVMFPLFSGAHRRDNQFKEVFARARRLHLVISGWLLSGLIGGGSVAIRLVYDSRYYEAGWMLQLLAVAGWCSTPEATNTQAALASGQPRWVAIGHAAKLVGMVALMPLGFYVAGFPGALLGFVASELLRYGASATAAYQLKLPALRQDLGFTGVVAGSSAASWFVARLLEGAGMHTIVQALAVFVVATLCWLPWLWPYLAVLGQKLRRRRAAA
jgi:O-antigen/teichoic acid export membrane protein